MGKFEEENVGEISRKIVLLNSSKLTKRADCYNMVITIGYCSLRSNEFKCREVAILIIEIDFNSDEAIYMQLRNRIIMGIATSELREGDSLPSVRNLAENIGINMHTVNKAYTVLKQEGFIQLDRRRGAVIAVDIDKLQALEDMKQNLRIILAKGCCKNITKEEVHALVEEIFEEYR